MVASQPPIPFDQPCLVALEFLFIISPAEVGETNLIADLGIDSIGVMELLTRVENQFKILIDDADVSPALVDSLNTLADYITQKKSDAAPS
jgi:acyl carrier protein